MAYRYSHPTEQDPEEFGTSPLTQADMDAGWTETPLYPGASANNELRRFRALLTRVKGDDHGK